MTEPGLSFVLRVTIGAICLWAAAEKVIAPRAFVRSLQRYELVPLRLASGVAFLVIAAEALVGLLLIFDVMTVVAAIAAVALFAMFSGAIAFNLRRGNLVPCHCFGASEAEPVSIPGLVRAIALGGLSVEVLVLALQQPATVSAADAVPLLSIASAFVLGFRLMGFFPQAYASLTVTPMINPTARHRTRFKNFPLDGSLRVSEGNTSSRRGELAMALAAGADPEGEQDG